MPERGSDSYVIGVDGGGKETVAALSDMRGRILKIGKAGPAHPRNFGIKKTSENIALAIRKVSKKPPGKILSTFIGLPALQEEFKNKKEEIRKSFFQQKGISSIFQGKVVIESDQLVAFRAGTNRKDGVLLIAGTGSVAHGWRGSEEVKSSGWGWLADEGAAFWVGQKSLQAIFKELDERGKETLLTKITFQKLRLKGRENLLTKIYSKNPAEIIPLFSVFCDLAARKGDKIAKEIFLQAAKELALAAKTVIKKLNFQNQEFPLVLVGGMFKSKIIFNTFKKNVKKFARKAKFTFFKGKAVVGAVRLAIEMIND